MPLLVRRSLLVLGGLGLSAVLFQNCGGGGFPLLETMDSASVDGAFQVATCLFNGQPIMAGTSVTAYQTPTAATEQGCVSETRTCTGGVLSGSFSNVSCLVTPPGDCALDNQKVANGATVTGFLAQQVGADKACSTVATSAVCTNGVITPKIYSTCSIATPTSCAFSGQFVPDGVSITAYLAASVPYGGLCSPQLRTCTNGVLSGSFTAATCTPAKAASCTFGNSIVANGASVQAFTTGKVAYGQTCDSAQTTITCRNGVFAFADGTSAANNYSVSCVPSATTSCVFANKTLENGASVSGYLNAVVAADQTCVSATATCNNGIITGVPKTRTPTGTDPVNSLYPTCSVGACYYNGNVVPNQQTVTAYKASVIGYSQLCTSVQAVLTCNNGTLKDSSGNSSSSYYSTCRPAASSTCSFSNYTDNTSIKVATGQTVTLYTSSSVLEGNSCASVQSNISCNDGIISLNGAPLPNGLGGTYYYSSCNVGACTISKQSVLNGATVTAFSSYYVAYGQSCTSVQATLTCRNSTLFSANGTANNYSTTCTPMTTPNCQVSDFSNGVAYINISNGQAITVYTRKTGGAACPNYKVTLSCNNGLLSESGGPLKPSAGIFYSTCQ